MTPSDAAGGAAADTRCWMLPSDAPVALAEADERGILTRASRRFCELVSRAHEELVGLELFRLLHDEDVAAHRLALGALVSGESGYRRDERYLRADGTAVPVTNEIVRTVAADQTPRLLVLAHASAGLLARAENHRERAEAEVRRRDEFLNLLSHELRSPLAAILVWARLLRDSSYDGLDARRGLEVIERSGVALERILDDLVQVSRIASGKLQLAGRCSLDLRSTARAAVDAVLPEANAKGVALSCSLPSRAVTLYGDPARLQQVIGKLLSNAVKFTPAEGSIELALETTASEAVLQVADTGEGMSQKALAVAFERFRVAEGPATRTQRGLGLGLYIARSLVAAHGGHIGASSPGPGLGSVFTIRLPLEQPVRTAEPCAQAEQPAIRPGLRVLIVDDDDDTREALRLILKQNQIAVETASSALEAIEKMRVLRPDIVLSDIAMPGEDGFALIRRIRSLSAGEGGRTPAAALTAYVSPGDRDAALRAGFDWHVPKPVDPPELLRVIARLSR